MLARTFVFLSSAVKAPKGNSSRTLLDPSVEPRYAETSNAIQGHTNTHTQ